MLKPNQGINHHSHVEGTKIKERIFASKGERSELQANTNNLAGSDKLI